MERREIPFSPYLTMGEDRNTGIHADQLQNHTVTPSEFDTENLVTDFNVPILLRWNHNTSQMRWDRPGNIEGNDSDVFEYDGNGDIFPITKPIFVHNDKGDLTPSVDGTEDFFFEIISNEIVPKE